MSAVAPVLPLPYAQRRPFCRRPHSTRAGAQKRQERSSPGWEGAAGRPPKGRTSAFCFSCPGALVINAVNIYVHIMRSLRLRIILEGTGNNTIFSNCREVFTGQSGGLRALCRWRACQTGRGRGSSSGWMTWWDPRHRQLAPPATLGVPAPTPWGPASKHLSCARCCR